jgi:cytochrome P450
VKNADESRNRPEDSARLPPTGPRSELLTLWRYLRDPHGATLRAFERYGDPHTTTFAGRPMVTTGNPELVRAILGADPDQFEAFGSELLGPILGEESLLILSGPRHRAARKLLTPPFHGERMRAYGTLIRDIVRERVAAFASGEIIVAQKLAQSISLEVIIRAVFGIQDRASIVRFQHVLVELMAALKPSLMFTPMLRRSLFGLGPWARLQRAMRASEALVLAEIASRRRRAAGEDILSLLLDVRYDDGTPMSDLQLYETLMTLLVAGHETSAVALAWACYWILRDEAIHERLLGELRGAADIEAIARIPYLEAVCNETLRLEPIAPAILRKVRSPFRLGEYLVPRDALVSASVIKLHLDPSLYPEPHAFRPERFLGSPRPPHEFLPFGGGARRCIGAAFALYEMKIVLATLLTSGTLRLCNPKPPRVVQRNTIIGPRDNVDIAWSPGGASGSRSR